MSEAGDLQQQADQIRANGAFGKPGPLSRLFDYLLQRSLVGEAPKEIEIALQVFGKSSNFDVTQDSVVRVYVHKLRRRLDEFYAGLPEPQTSRIAIPKGEYRLTVERALPPVTESPPPVRQPRSWRWLVSSLALSAAVAVGALLTLLVMNRREDPGIRSVRDSAIWAPLLQDDLPITIVVGDYYLLGEVDASNSVQRLVREFFINSPADFVYQVEASPKLMERYRNLDLSYLPTATAFALQDIVPMLGTRKQVRVMLVSDLNGGMLKASHIVYIGYLSGMGLLGDPAFAASRLSLGGSYDELTDSKTNTQYVSTAVEEGDARYIDYGFFSTFPGPGRNRVVIIAGTRDTGVTHIAEAVTTPSIIADMGRQAGNAVSFEALYEVYGVAHAGMNAKLLFVSALEASGIWE